MASDDQHPALSALSPGERSSVLQALLAIHPDLRDVAERLAIDLLTDVDRDAVMTEVVDTYLDQSYLDIADRVGRQPGRGYVHETDAQSELLNEALDPFEQDLVRLARLGFATAAQEVALGVLAGLHELGKIADEQTLIGWGPLEDHTEDLAQSLLHTCREVDIDVPVTDVDPSGTPSSEH